jgi:hypothetical protein
MDLEKINNLHNDIEALMNPFDELEWLRERVFGTTDTVGQRTTLPSFPRKSNFSTVAPTHLLDPLSVETTLPACQPSAVNFSDFKANYYHPFPGSAEHELHHKSFAPKTTVADRPLNSSHTCNQT